MHDLLLKLYITGQNLKDRVTSEDGQDLVEYAMLVALVALFLVVSLQTLATDIAAVFTNIDTTLGKMPAG